MHLLRWLLVHALYAVSCLAAAAELEIITLKFRSAEQVIEWFELGGSTRDESRSDSGLLIGRRRTAQGQPPHLGQGGGNQIGCAC